MHTPAISIIILSYNNARYIEPCLDHVMNQTFCDFEVIAVDNNSHDDSVALFKKYPIRVIENKENVGGCAGDNMGILQGKGRYILLLDTDTRMRPDVLKLLYDFMETHPDVGACMGKLMLGDTGTINSAGNAMNILGHAWCVGQNERDCNQYATRYISSVSGACFFARKSALDHVGMYDPDLFIYHEDADLSLRFLLYGYKLAFVNEAVVEHHYSVTVNTRTKYYYLERNRWISILKNYQPTTLLLLGPLLLFQECGIVLYCATHRLFWMKIKGYFWNIRQLPRTYAKRHTIQTHRSCSDAVVFTYLEKSFNYADISNTFIRFVLNPVIRGYAKMFFNNTNVTGVREPYDSSF
jgi:GT2 family glycosyltransferase